MNATISADIVSSTTLSEQETIALKDKMQSLFDLLEERFPGFWGRQVKGDYIECWVPEAQIALRIALIIKSYIKSFDIEETKEKRSFQIYGVRVSIGIGTMRIVNREAGIMDGEAIYSSGRNLEKLASLNKGTMSIDLPDVNLRPALSSIVLLLDALVNSATRRQSEVLFYKLLSTSENEIAEKLHINQSAVNQRSSAAKWYCIEDALQYFEHLNFG